MGFKQISQEELETIAGPCFIGMPIRKAKDLDVGREVESIVKKQSTSSERVSNIFIKNEEIFDFHYDHYGKRTMLSGYGNLSLYNNSYKDRIWDSKLKLSGSQFVNIDTKGESLLGIFEPNSNKTLNYEIINSENLPDIIKIKEKIVVINNEIRNETIKPEETRDEEIESKLDEIENKKLLILIGKENIIKFTISIENISSYNIDNIKFKKSISKLFYNIQFESNLHKNFNIKNEEIESVFSELKSGQKIDIIITAKIFPKKKEYIRTGTLELVYDLKNSLISGITVENFSAYSHAMHAINKIEEEDEPNNWNCTLKFENHSDFPIILKSVLVIDNLKSETYLDDPNLKNKIMPGDGYISKVWKIKNDTIPKFSRKVEYSVDYSYEKLSIITTKIDDYSFELINIELKKEISKEEVKSFEESEISNKIIINNIGTLPVDFIRIKETIPRNFLPPLEKSKLKINSSKSELNIDLVAIDIIPNDQDPTKEHKMEIRIESNNHQKYVLEIDDFLELEYPVKAVNPDNKLDYDFPLEVDTYYHNNNNLSQKNGMEYFILTKSLDKEKQPKLKISHRRRKITVEKEIFPGKNVDEFAININVKNLSNVEIKDINISDNFPSTFKFISATEGHELSKSEDGNYMIISFLIENMLPFQEKEIMFYLKNESGENLQISDLESFIYG